MLLSELIDTFLTDYKFECVKRDVRQIELPPKYLVMILSKSVSEIQKNFGVIETSLPISILANTDKYDLTASVMKIKNVVSGEVRLVEKSTKWMEEQIIVSGTPQYYSSLYQSGTPKLWIYPKPIDMGTLIVNHVSNFNLYSPSSTSKGDFGDYGITNSQDYYGNTVFPTQYDTLILLGMMKQFFKDVETDYLKEKIVSMAKQVNGESLNKYKMNGVI
jgi:hypothetical protein